MNLRKTSEKFCYDRARKYNLWFFLNNHKIDLKETENLLGVKAARAREILSNMVKKWIPKKIGKTKGNYYILKTGQNDK